MTKLRWGILGTAGIARKAVLPALRAASGCEIVAIASRSPARAQAMAEAFEIPHVFADYEALLADPRIDAIYNPLPNHLHVPLTLKALDAGKHVLCEKPLAMTADEARLVVAHAARAGRVVAEAFMTRHHPQWARAKALVEAGRIGRLTGIQALFSYRNTDPKNVRNQPDIGGGGLYDIGCYAIDTARFFFGSEPEAVAASMERDPRFGTDRLTTGAARFAQGHLSFMVATQSALAQSLTLLGTEGYLLLDAPFNCPPDRPAALVIDGGRDLLGSARETELIGAADQYRLQVERFAAHILHHAPLPAGPADIIANAAALEAFTRSAETGGWVQLSSVKELART